MVTLVIGGPLAWVVLAAALVVLADTLVGYGNGRASFWDVGFALLGCIPGAKGLTTVGGLARGIRGAADALHDGRAVAGVLHGGAALAHSTVDATRAHLAAVVTDLRRNLIHTVTVVTRLGPRPASAGVCDIGYLGDVPTSGNSLMTDARGASGRSGESRRPWGIKRSSVDKEMQHPKFGSFTRERKSQLWWSKDLTGHGGSTWKVFEEKERGLQWVADADEYGQFINNKHKGNTGMSISWKEFKIR
ncbi:hypothetical protein [Frankia sp. Cppng1_Ct_nod]|uniref:hypothetical protein n=1 Tax=Frankia sp. Cppng1_Ct_nod TaxID=2897162 RepID=UPI0010418BB1|nr:hypothetical protein [Frankia sp. Cppng1_Ct_nod]